MFLKKDEDYFALIQHSILESTDSLTEEVYTEIVKEFTKKKKTVLFSQTYLDKDNVNTIIGTVDLKKDHSLAMNAFMFELYAFMKDKTEVSKDFPLQIFKINNLDIRIYTINNKLFKEK